MSANMKVWTVVNQKGGVGKTTSAISIAGELSKMGSKVLLLDLDPQASLTHYLGIDSTKLTSSVYDLFIASQFPDNLQKTVATSVIQTNISNISLIPSHTALATLDRTLAQQAGKGLIVKNLCAILANQFDYIIIDCQPVLGVLMVNALVAAQQVIIPTQTEHLALLGLDKMLTTISQMTPNLASNLRVNIVPTLFDRRVKACVDSYKHMRKQYSENLWRGYIPVDTKFRDASMAGVPINILAKNARGTFAYEKLVMDLLKNES